MSLTQNYYSPLALLDPDERAVFGRAMLAAAIAQCSTLDERMSVWESMADDWSLPLPPRVPADMRINVPPPRTVCR